MNHSCYKFTEFFDEKGHMWHLDKRHIDILYDLAISLPQDSLICEIGCCRGASTSAFIEAMKLRKDLYLLLFDIKITTELLRLVNESGVKNRVEIRECPAYENMVETAQLVFIDGNHGWPALADLSICLTLDCTIIVLHDTNGYSPAIRKHQHGSILASKVLKRSHNRSYWEDYKRRKGEKTHRGLLVSWPKEEEWICSVLQ